jgi:uncharacterized membrane protein YeaQ/YmgE (transglycosylase-associated protein family)
MLVIGGLAGWIAGKLTKSGGFGILGNILLGVVGGLVGGYLFRAIGWATGGSWIGELVAAVIGAIVLIALARVLRKA